MKREQEKSIIGDCARTYRAITPIPTKQSENKDDAILNIKVKARAGKQKL